MSMPNFGQGALRADARAGRTTDSNAASDSLLRQRARGFIEAWRHTRRGDWQVDLASAMYEDLERLATAAEAVGATEIAEPALALTVYLCSFVDGNAKPSVIQRQAMDQLVERLDAAAGQPSAGQADMGSAELTAGREVFYIRSRAREIVGLAGGLGRLGYTVLPFEGSEPALAALEKVSPDALLVDETLITDVHRLTEAARRLRPAHKDASLCLLLCGESDAARVQSAQRAGADAVITERDPIALAACLDVLWAQRRALGYRVLIVEDDRGQAKFCESILRHRGMITSVCDDPMQVPAALDEFRPDLMLLDFYMPGRNGIEVAQQTRESGHAFLPIVFLTGAHDVDVRFDAIRIGADDFITKPVKPRHLVTTVESRVRRARQLAAGGSAGRGERRGHLSGRDVFAKEALRAAREEQEDCPALALIAVDDAEDVQRSVGFVAASTLSQQLASALAAEMAGSRSLCHWRDLRYLALVHGDAELAVREQFEEVRRRLDARPWLSEAAPVRLHVSIGCVRLHPQMTSFEEMLERAGALCAKAQLAGGARCEFDLHLPTAEVAEDPKIRLVRAILRSPNVHGTAQLSFQPLLPLAGPAVRQYEVRMALCPPKSAQSLLHREDYLPIARDLGMVTQADRHLLRSVLEFLRDRKDSAAGLRLFVPIDIASLFDVAFAPWLAAELGANGLSADLLVLEFDADGIRSGLSRVHGALDSLLRIGVGLALRVPGDIDVSLSKLLAVDAFSVVKVLKVRSSATAVEAAWTLRSKVIAEARALGKAVLVSDIDNIGELGNLLKLGVQHIQGELLSGWLAELNFDFEAAL